MSMKNPNDRTGNRTRDLPACSLYHVAMPQPTDCPVIRLEVTERKNKSSTSMIGNEKDIRIYTFRTQV
jgi:hypothetical protein